MAVRRGAFIVFEGLDRSGKSTQATKLFEELNTQGQKAHIFRFPDRTEPFGQVIDRYLRKEIDVSERALHLAFSANRWEKADAIEQALLKGEHVICDRYAFSGMAYSMAKGLPEDWVRWADVGLPQPDLVLFFYVDAEVAKARGGFGDERLEQEELQRRVAQKMETLRADYWKTVDANKELAEVSQSVRALVKPLLAAQLPAELARLPAPKL